MYYEKHWQSSTSSSNSNSSSGNTANVVLLGVVLVLEQRTIEKTGNAGN